MLARLPTPLSHCAYKIFQQEYIANSTRLTQKRILPHIDNFPLCDHSTELHEHHCYARSYGDDKGDDRVAQNTPDRSVKVIASFQIIVLTVISVFPVSSCLNVASDAEKLFLIPF